MINRPIVIHIDPTPNVQSIQPSTTYHPDEEAAEKHIRDTLEKYQTRGIKKVVIHRGTMDRRAEFVCGWSTVEPEPEPDPKPAIEI